MVVYDLGHPKQFDSHAGGGDWERNPSQVKYKFKQWRKRAVV